MIRRKELLTIPVKEVSKQLRSIYTRSSIKYIMTATLESIKDEKLLVLNFFEVGNEGTKLLYRTYNFATRYENYIVAQNKWTKARFEYLIGINRWHLSKIMVATAKEEKIINRFCKNIVAKYNVPKHELSYLSNEAFNSICNYNTALLINARRIKKDKELERYNKDMKPFRAMNSKKFKDFVVNNSIMDCHKMFFDIHKGTCVCTKCQTSFNYKKNGILVDGKYKKLKHKQTYNCPACDTVVVASNQNIARHLQREYYWTTVVQLSSNNDLLTRHFRHTISFVKQDGAYTGEIELTTKEMLRCINDKDYMFTYNHSFGLRGWFPYRDSRPYYMQTPVWAEPVNGTYYYNSLGEIEKMLVRYNDKCKDISKYLADMIDRTKKGRFANAYLVEMYPRKLEKYPILELLTKAGLYKLARAVGGYGFSNNETNNEKGSLHSKLGITKAQYKYLVENNGGSHILKTLKELKSLDFTIQKEILALPIFDKYGNSLAYKLINANRKGFRIDRLVKYCKQSKFTYNQIKDYLDDHLKYIKELGIKDTKVIYPKNFEAEHMRLAELVAEMKVEIIEARHDKLARAFVGLENNAEFMNTVKKGYIFRIAGSDELKNESEVLHHCVKNYKARVDNKQTMIIFVRKDADTPLYTLEFNGKLEQFRGAHNCEPEPEAVEAVTQYIDWLDKKLEHIPKQEVPMACPKTGKFIAYKKVCNNLIVKLEVPEDALRSSAESNKCRCSKANVLAIENIDGTDAGINKINSLHDRSFIYKIGETVEVRNFDTNRWNEAVAGIHFFMDRKDAVAY